VPQFILEQVKELAQLNREDKITVLTTSRPNESDTDLPSNVSIQRFSYFWPPHKQNLTNYGILPSIKNNKLNILQIPLLFLFELIALVRSVIRDRPDVIYSHWMLPQGILCHFVCKAFNIPHVFTTHSYDVEICKKLPIIGPMLVRKAIYRMAKITAVSQRTLNGISYFFSEKEWIKIQTKVMVIPMGIQPPPELAEKITPLANKENCKIVFMGRFVKKKGIHNLLSAVFELLKTYPNLELVLAGSGMEKENILKQIQRLSLSNNVTLPGFVSNEEKIKLLQTASIFILPSIDSDDGDREGLPVSLLESMSYGNLCVATKSSGAGDILSHKKNGYLYEAEDIGHLVRIVTEILTKSQKEKNTIRHEAKLTAERYYWKNIAARYRKHLFSDVENSKAANQT